MSDGNFDIPEFTHSQSYFLWDDDALYMCSKIYDSTLMTLDDEQTAAIVGDSPWLVDGIMHMLYVSESTASENYFFVQSPAGGNAIWENDQTRWSTLGDFVRDSAEKRLEDAQNIATTLNTDEGYYILEMRVPLTETAKETLLKDGQRFGYNFMLVDSFGGWATNCGSKYRINYTVKILCHLSFHLKRLQPNTHGQRITQLTRQQLVQKREANLSTAYTVMRLKKTA